MFIGEIHRASNEVRDRGRFDVQGDSDLTDGQNKFIPDTTVPIIDPPERRFGDTTLDEPGPSEAAPAPTAGQPPAPPEGPEADFEDLANASRLIEEYGADLLYCEAAGGWFTWDGKRFKLCENGGELIFAQKVARSILAGAETDLKNAQRALHKATDVDAVKKATRVLATAKANYGRAARVQGDRRIRSMLSQAAPRLAVSVDELDAHPLLLNTATGTLDLKTGKLLPHDRNQRLTKMAPVAYEEAATAPIWDRALGEIMPDKEVRDFFQRLIGLALIGKVIEHVFPILWGGGRNGKGLTMGAILEAVGDYGTPLPVTEVTKQRLGRHTEGRASLRGVRIVIVSESDEDNALDESCVKELTGGDAISARRNYGHQFQIRYPSWTFFMQTNHRPDVKGVDAGIWSRLLLVPYTQSFAGREDTGLADKIRMELPGVLLWAVKGCLEYQRIGLSPPKAVTAATADYRNQEDELAEWLTLYCMQGDGLSEAQKDLYKSFLDLQREQGVKEKSYTSGKRFSTLLESHGFEKSTRRVGNSYLRLGLRLMSDYERAKSASPVQLVPDSLHDCVTAAVEKNNARTLEPEQLQFSQDVTPDDKLNCTIASLSKEFLESKNIGTDPLILEKLFETNANHANEHELESPISGSPPPPKSEVI